MITITMKPSGVITEKDTLEDAIRFLRKYEKNFARNWETKVREWHG